MTTLSTITPAILLARFALFFSPLPGILRDDHQLSSPLSSFARLKEGLYLYREGIDPYSGGLFHQSPLVLAAFSTYFPTHPIASAILWTAIDGLGSWALTSIYCIRLTSRSSAPATASREALISALYLLNPYLLLPNLARSLTSFENTIILLTLKFASEGRLLPALLLLALATHVSLYSVLLLPATVLLLLQSRRSTTNENETETGAIVSATQFIQPIATFTGYLAVLCGLARLVAGSWRWVDRTWGAAVMLPDLTPNPGLWWYFFTEMFDHFRPFFLAAFTMHPLMYAIPFCVKFSHDPLYAVFVTLGVSATLKPYPTLVDPGLFISLFSIFPEVFPYLRHPIVTILLHMHAVLLLPLFHSLWLSQGTGNANFYYATTLVFGLAMAASVIDAIWAGLRSGFGSKPEGWDMVQI